MADITITIYDIDGNPTTFIGPEKDLGELLTLKPPKYFTSADDAKRYKENQGATTVPGGKTFNEIFSQAEFGPSIPADITNYELDKLAVEYGEADSVLGSVLKRIDNRL